MSSDREDRSVNELLLGLQDVQASLRQLAADYLSDWFEYQKSEAKQQQDVLERLVISITREEAPIVREAMLNALIVGMTHAEQNVDQLLLEPLIPILGTFEPASLEHALVALGLSGNKAYQEIISEFLVHPQEYIRQTAAEALKELAAPRKS